MRFLSFVFVMIIAGCSKPKPSAGQPGAPAPTRESAAVDDWRTAYVPKNDAWRKVEQHFLLANTAEPEGLDPGIVTGVPEDRLLRALFEGLTSSDPKTLEARPGTAKSWDISADGLTYTFQLREDARWSDGKPVTSQDFYDSWKRVLTPATAATYAYQLYPIANAEAFQKGKLTDFAKVGITAPDDHTLVATLGAPCPYFLDLCAFFTLYPVRVDVIEAHGDRWQRPEHMVSNGPFKLTAWEARQHITMEKNPHYWDVNFVKLEKITAYPYDNLDTVYNLFLNKKIHWSPAIPQPKLEEIKRNADYYVVPYLGTYFYRFNCSKPPFDDPAVRKAFSQAVDRSIITIKRYRHRHAMVQYGMVRHAMLHYAMLRYCTLRYGMIQYGTVQYGMVRCGMLWYGMLWYGIVGYSTLHCRTDGRKDGQTDIYMRACVRMYVRNHDSQYL